MVKCHIAQWAPETARWSLQTMKWRPSSSRAPTAFPRPLKHKVVESVSCLLRLGMGLRVLEGDACITLKVSCKDSPDKIPKP